MITPKLGLFDEKAHDSIPLHLMYRLEFNIYGLAISRDPEDAGHKSEFTARFGREGYFEEFAFSELLIGTLDARAAPAEIEKFGFLRGRRSRGRLDENG